jgi:hypothetical protein
LRDGYAEIRPKGSRANSKRPDSAGVFWTQIQQAEKPGMGERCDLEATFFQQISGDRAWAGFP